jgi:iron only hydrogenase large subunit-like protein
MFSGIVKIADIDDYITPSQNCIKPISNSKTTTKGKQIMIESEEQDSVKLKPDLIKLKDNKTTAKVSLADCLACTGCVTTAETLLIQAQSVDEFLKNTMDKDTLSIVCISPQSVLSFAYYHGVSDIEAMDMLCKALQLAGVEFVLNFNTAIPLVLELAYREWKNREKDYIICSECPGWICYAEKKIGEWVIPFTSKVKSPQQILGHAVKNMFSKMSDKRIYLTCIMPCFDKKLEASRESHKIGELLEVDTVISTNELIELFEKLNTYTNDLQDTTQNVYFDFRTLHDKLTQGLNSTELLKKDYTFDKQSFKVIFQEPHNFSSNCYAEYIMSRYIKDNGVNNYSIERKTIKNNDFRELNLIVDGVVILSFALVYGFRNIQNIVRNKNKIKYPYIEIMACPGGCINGGGQMRSKNEESARDILTNIEIKYVQNDKLMCESLDFTKETDVLRHYLDEVNIYTDYKALDKHNTINLKW